MRLNLPILDLLANSQRVLIAGAGGGYDIFAGLPIYFTLREAGKTVHLANYSFSEIALANVVDALDVLLPDLLAAARGRMRINLPYYPEGFLAQWFREVRGEEVPVWMFGRPGVLPLTMAYTKLIDHLGGVDALILVDGGVDSLMRGDEVGAGTLLEDTITLTAVEALDIPVKVLACIGFGTEVEEAVDHRNALENMAALAAAGAFYGSCALTVQMPVFQLYEAACRYAWEQPDSQKSHISTRIIPAVHGKFGDYHMYPTDRELGVFISPLMTLYWFYDAAGVLKRSLIADVIRDALTHNEAFSAVMRWRQTLKEERPRGRIPY